eukprot:8434779-Pyramimonas_sp.AAC.1
MAPNAIRARGIAALVHDAVAVSEADNIVSDRYGSLSKSMGPQSLVSRGGACANATTRRPTSTGSVSQGIHPPPLRTADFVQPTRRRISRGRGR